jgi:hypothetical protein
MAAWGLLMLPSWAFYRFAELPSTDLGKWYVRKSISEPQESLSRRPLA